MIVSRSRRFCFVEVPKTASTSMKTALMPYMELPRIARHATCRQILDHYPETRNYFKFGFLREYQDWRASMERQYSRRLQGAGTGLPGDYARVKYLRSRHLLECHPDDWLDGCDYVGNFHTLEDSWYEALELAGLPMLPLPHLNKRPTP